MKFQAFVLQFNATAFMGIATSKAACHFITVLRTYNFLVLLYVQTGVCRS